MDNQLADHVRLDTFSWAKHCSISNYYHNDNNYDYNYNYNYNYNNYNYNYYYNYNNYISNYYYNISNNDIENKMPSPPNMSDDAFCLGFCGFFKRSKFGREKKVISADDDNFSNKKLDKRNVRKEWLLVSQTLRFVARLKQQLFFAKMFCKNKRRKCNWLWQSCIIHCSVFQLFW